MAESTTTILVTCANGNPGSEVVKSLAGLQGTQVRAAVHLARRSEKVRDIPGVQVVEAELLDSGSLDLAFKGVDKIFSVLPLSSQMEAMAANVAGAARRAGVRQIVHLSILNADIGATNSISGIHSRCEKIVIDSGIPYTIIRSTMFFQNLVYYYREFIKRGLVVQPSGKARISLIDLRDVAKLAAMILTEGQEKHAGRIHSVTSGESYTGQQSAEVFAQVLGRKMAYFDRPRFMIIKGMREAGISDWLIKSTLELFADFQNGKFDLKEDTFEKIAGVKSTTFPQFIRDYAIYFR